MVANKTRTATPKKTAAARGSRTDRAPAEPAPAEPTPLQERIAAYPDHFIVCRDIGHHWKPRTANYDKDGNIVRIMTCSACTTDRYQTIDSRGYVLRNDYQYREGYIMPGTGRPDSAFRALIRLQSAIRSIKQPKKTTKTAEHAAQK